MTPDTLYQAATGNGSIVVLVSLGLLALLWTFVICNIDWREE